MKNMLKNIQVQIILVFTILGVVVIAGLGYLFSHQLEHIDQALQTSNREMIEQEASNIQKTTLYAIGVFVGISAISIIFVSKVISSPIQTLTKNAKDIAKGKKVDMSNMNFEKPRNDIQDLVNAFRNMTIQLNERLDEASRQKKQIETILLHMTDGIIAFDLNGEIIHINPASRKLLKLDENDNNFETIFKKLGIDINIEKIIYLENWTSSEQKVDLQDRYVNMLFAPFKDENERPAGVIAVIQDITEHVKLDNMRKEFVADVSHELKTPITSIMGYADTLLEGEYDKETQDKFLNVIATEARRMAKLVTDLLTLSRYDSNKKRTQKELFDLGDLVKKCQDKLAIEIKKKNHTVNCFVTADVPPVYADKYDIERVILNILTNSIKYTKDGGEIKIYVGFVYNDAYIKIFDNGIGIPEEDLSRIFERFYRVDKARTREMGGTGLRSLYSKRNSR